MNAIALKPREIYNVYQGGGLVNVSVTKWGNSLGIRVPSIIVEAMKIRPGDTLSCELKENQVIIRKNITTRQLFEEYYNKPFNEISLSDLGPGGELDWGEDVGGEVF